MNDTNAAAMNATTPVDDTFEVKVHHVLMTINGVERECRVYDTRGLTEAQKAALIEAKNNQAKARVNG